LKNEISDGAYDEGINALFEFSGSSASSMTHRYLWSDQVDEWIADSQITSLSNAGNTLWALSDHLGTIRDIADYTSGTDSTAITNHRTYNAYGKLVSETNSAVDLIFGFTCKQLDEATGLQHNLFRWYDSNLGQWLSEDPISFAAGDENVKRYVKNNVTANIDAYGLAPKKGGVTNPNDVVAYAQGVRFGMEIQSQMKKEEIKKLLNELSDSVAKSSGRYVFTEEYGWIDLRHFYAAASATLDYSPTIVWGGGVLTEFSQWISEGDGDYRSAYSSEDFPSNYAGIDFGKTILYELAPSDTETLGGETLSRKVDVIMLLQDWLKVHRALGVDDPVSHANDLPPFDPSDPNTNGGVSPPTLPNPNRRRGRLGSR
jgi:RHS repeat-associated protein